MEIDLENAKRPLRKLRKALKRLPPDPSVEDVHSLRTQTRRLEAIVDALMLEDKKKTRQLLKSVDPVRKAAGEVRDMDVLVGHVLALPRTHENDDALIRLVEHLGEMRVEGVRELHHTVTANKRNARRGLKSYSRMVQKRFPGKQQNSTATVPGPAGLLEELAQWPALDAGNIHEFRIKVKQLRYMLQLSRAADRKTVEALGKVKDEVGDWHDWQELARIAHQVLSPEADQGALKRIAEIGTRKFKQALKTANEVRDRYLVDGRPSAHRNSRKRRAKARS